MTAAQAQSSLNRRILIERFGHIEEATLIEISPSKTHIKLKWPSASKSWYPIDEYDFVEALPGTMEVSVKDINLDEINRLFEDWQYGRKTDGPDSAIGSDRWKKDGKQGI